MPIIPTSADVPVVSGARLAGRVTRVPEIRAPASGLVQVGEQAIVLSQRLQDAKQRLDTRRDTAERMRDFGAVKQFANDEFRRVVDEEDVFLEETGQAFISKVDAQIQSVVAAHRGSAESRLQLEAKLLELRIGLVDDMAVESNAALLQSIEEGVGEGQADIISRMNKGELTLTQALATSDALIVDAAPGLARGRERELAFAGRQQFTRAHLDGLLAGGAFRDVEEFLQNTRGLDELLTAKDIAEYNTRAIKMAKAVADKAAGGDVGTATKRMVDTAQVLTEAGVPRGAVADVLGTMTDGSPQSESAAAAVIASLPESPEAGGRARGRVDVAEKEATVGRLVAAGVDPEIAALAVHGNVSLDVTTQKPGELSAKELADTRNQVRALRGVVTAIDDVLPLIDEDTVGIWGQISEEVGGRLQQFAITRTIVDSIGGVLGLDGPTVRKALEARNAFRAAIAQLAPFVKGRDQRLTNQDREFIMRASGLLEAAIDARSARATMQRLGRIASRMLMDRENILRTGTVFPEEEEVTVLEPEVKDQGEPERFATEADVLAGVEEGEIIRDNQAGKLFIKEGNSLRELTPEEFKAFQAETK